jgi:LysM repeat protein
MKWRHWAILIVLVLLNYIIFSTAFMQLAEQRRPQPRPTRTPQPTFESVEPTVVAWIVLPTSTPLPTKTPITPSPTVPISATVGISSTVDLTASATGPDAQIPAEATAPPQPTATPVPPTPTASSVIHTVESGETLSEIAQRYGVTIEAIVEANSLQDASQIIAGQELVIPASDQVPPTATPMPQATQPPTPRPTKKPPPPTATPKPPPTATAAIARFQYTGEIVWNPLVAPNCSGPAISKESVIRDAAGNPVDGVLVEVDCYDNRILSHASGTPGEYESGHYDFAFGQDSPQDWTCTARVVEHNGQPVESSEVVTIVFDTRDCEPDGGGHQVAIVNWTKHW